MDIIRGDQIQQALVVGDQQGGIFRASELIDPIGHDAQGIDIKA